MLSFKVRRTILTCLVAALWLGAVGFFAARVAAPAQEVFSLYQDVARGDENLQDWSAPGQTIPTERLIEAHTDLKFAMRAEADQCAWFYLSHNKQLDERILVSWTPDPFEVANKYRALQRSLANKAAGNPGFIEMGVLDDWLKDPAGAPDKKDFAAIEKRACIAKVLVDLLCADGSTVIELIDLSAAPITPADVPAPPPSDWDLNKYRLTRHRVFPVVVTFSTRFSTLGRLLDRIAQNPGPVPPGRPRMVMRAIRVAQMDSDSPHNVRVKLGLDVYDFRRLER